MSQPYKPGMGARARRLAARYGMTGGKAAIALLCVLLACVAAAGIWFSAGSSGVVLERVSAEDASGDGAAADKQEESASPSVSQVYVHVDGAVASPGVYVLAEGARVNDAVVAAGGLTEDADTSTTNLAAPLADGAKVHIPTGEELSAPVTSGGEGPASGDASSGASANALVNINTATSAELQTLTGVGEATAKSIIEDREANGPFASPEDLMRVPGIAEKKFAKIESRICV